MNEFRSANILLPKDADWARWAVIACDQFTSEPEYWKRVRAFAGDAPSTIHMILPVSELEGDEAAAVKKINTTMQQYLDRGVFATCPDSYIYVERTQLDGTIRAGLVGMVDLEHYDYNSDSTSAIRATERTVLERLPARQRIRQGAPIEFPHVLMLCDDSAKQLIEPFAQMKAALPVVYNFDLMEGGGHITGYLVSGEQAQAFDVRYAVYRKDCDSRAETPVVLAVGDGNHSLAAAKLCYEAQKAENPGAALLSRYALVELENIHSPAIQFEPIHRILTGVDADAVIEGLEALCKAPNMPIQYVTKEGTGTMLIDSRPGELPISALQTLLDEYLKSNPGQIDYIHDDDTLIALSQKENALGFLLPAIGKDQLFGSMSQTGVLPRKTFSMGHAQEKRYYLEGRKIR